MFLAVCVLITYGHTLDVPFYLDDYPSIVNNRHIVDPQGVEPLFRFAPLRIVGYLSFALNHHLHQFQVAGYHLLNILIHLLTGCGVLLLSRGLIETPGMKGKISESGATWLPFLSALVFVLHPLQTQAVTYTVQRLASMAAMFYIYSAVLYVLGRLSNTLPRKGLLYSASLCLGVLAFFTKQNTVTLPAALLLIEALFFPEDKRGLALKTCGLLLLLGAAWTIVCVIFDYAPFSLDAMQAMTRETKTIGRWEYLLTQAKVLWIYIKLFFWPAGLHLDYDIPIAASLFEWKVLAGLSGHLLVAAGALIISRRFPLFSFALIFYYLAHAVESSIIPIRDVCFEHRTYLPNLGLCLGAGGLGALLITGKSRLPAWLLLLPLIAMATATWQRNQQWRDPIPFWRDCLRYSPMKSRPWNDLAVMLLRAGRIEEASAAIDRAMKRVDRENPGKVELNEITAVNLVTLLRIQEKYDESLELSRSILRKKLRPWNRYRILDNMGLIHLKRGAYPMAENAYTQALRVSRWNTDAMHNLGTSLMLQGRKKKALKIFKKIIKKDPRHELALGKIALLSGEQPIPVPGTP